MFRIKAGKSCLYPIIRSSDRGAKRKKPYSGQSDFSLRQIPSTGGLAILFGKIAEQSAVVKTEAIDPLAFAEAASSNVKHL